MIEIAGLPAHILLSHAVVLLAAGAFFIYQGIITGHSGASSVWSAR